MLLELPFD